MNAGTLKHMVLQQMFDHHQQLYSYGDALRWALQVGLFKQRAS